MSKYMQTDGRWGGLGYPKKPWYLRNCGCGEVSIANVIIEMDKYAGYTPATIQPYCKQFADSKGNGTFWSGIPKMMAHYGITEVKDHATMSTLWTELAKGDRVAIYLMGSRKGGSKKVHWTSSGHFVCSTDYKYENGKHYVYVKDSYSNASNRNGWLTYEEHMRNDVLKVWSGKITKISSTAYRPTTPYTGTLPTKTVKKGTKGDDAKAVQTFLNWCINSKLSLDGNCGNNTTRAIKVYQKTYGLSADGVFGNKSKAKAQEIIKSHEKQTYTGTFPTLTLVKTNAEVIADTIKWAKWIVGDNRFHYGKKPNAQHNGCYFCGTNTLKGGRAKTGVLDYERSYCCNPFVGAAWAHGGCVPTALNLCRKGSSWDFHKGKGYDASSLFTNLGKPSKGSLKAGDVLCKDNHVALYIGGGKIAHASGGDDNKRNSTKWNNSIRTETLTDSMYKNFKRVHRYNGSVNTSAMIRHGEVSNRVAHLQAFLDWYYNGKVGTADGIFGDNTLKWVKQFQTDMKLSVDGVVGEKTIDAMKKAVR